MDEITWDFPAGFVESLNPTAKEKRCWKCKLWKPASEFYSSSQFTDRLHHTCRSCLPKYQRLWNQKNPQRLLIHRNRYYRKNRRRVLDRHKFRKRLEQLTKDPITEEDWQSLILQFKHCCAYCGKHNDYLERDHIMPVSRGGLHTKENIVPACISCNRRKGAKTPEEAGMSIQIF